MDKNNMTQEEIAKDFLEKAGIMKESIIDELKPLQERNNLAMEVFSKAINGETYFFSRDQDCHWYMIPTELKDKWLEMTANDTDDQDEIDKFDELFAEHRTGGGIDDIEFIPIKEKQ